MGLHSLSAAATPPRPSDASVPPTRAAPINLIALPREMLPLASPLVSSSKERLEVCWLTRFPFSPKGGTRGLTPPCHATQLSMKGYKAWRNFREFFLGELRRTPLRRSSPCPIAPPR